MPRLADLAGSDVDVPAGMATIDVGALTADSRTVKPGSVFVAVPGARLDGRTFIADAVARGAAAVVVRHDDPLPESIPASVAVLRSCDPRRSLALMAARLHPRQPRHVVAVTGTSGKTSVAEFTRQICQHLGHSAASIGTLGVVRAGAASYGSLTTPDPVRLHRDLDALAGDGVTHVAMEASSHGLDQRRLDGVRLEAAAFLNIGRDHLDYHPTVEHYLAAKLRLFREVAPAIATAVINADGAAAADATAAAHGRQQRVITVGAGGETLRLTGVAREGFRQRISVACGGREDDVTLRLIGTYQASNVLVAAGLAMAMGETWADIAAVLPSLQPVRGRLDIVAEHNGGLVVVDYAHKPDALEAALDALRPFATGRLISVFGCGGDRDRGKRSIMGRISVAKADVTIVTDDNPRSEQPAGIRAQILEAAPGALEIGDRGEAIRAAIAMMRAGDVVLLAGKGHEEGQIIGDRTLPFSDHAAALAAVAGGPA